MSKKMECYQVILKTSWTIYVDVDPTRCGGQDPEYAAILAAAQFCDDQHLENCWTWRHEDDVTITELAYDPDDKGGMNIIVSSDGNSYVHKI